MEGFSRRTTSDSRASLALADSVPAAGAPNGPDNSTDDSAWAKKLLLSFDGGGIRRLSSLFILKELMVQIQMIELEDDVNPATHSFCPLEYRPPRVNAEPIANGNGRRSLSLPLMPRISPSDEPPNRSGPEYTYLPCHYFDFIAGTSTGGLIAMMLGRLRMTVGHCIEEYILLGAEVFGKPRTFCARSPLYWNRGKYHSGNVEKVVNHVAEKYNPSVQTQGWARITLNCPETLCKTMVFATQEDDMRPYIFRSYDHKLKTTSAFHYNPGGADTNPMSVVGRATSAAPGYFNPFPIGNKTFLDGGLVANNPTHYAYHEVRLLQNNRPPMFVLSIGTGKKNKRSFKSLERFFPHWAPFISLELNNKIAKSESAHDQKREQLDQRPTWEAFEYARLTVTTDFGLGWMKLDEWKRKALSRTRARDAQLTAREFKHDREYSREKRNTTIRWSFLKSGQGYTYPRTASKINCNALPDPWWRPGDSGARHGSGSTLPQETPGNVQFAVTTAAMVTDSIPRGTWNAILPRNMGRARTGPPENV